MLPARSALDRLAVPLLLVAGLLLHVPWLWAPFGFQDVNAGGFFGPFAQSWERFGFFELRGIPLSSSPLTILQTPAEGYPYFNHPPGFAWMCGILGSAEWQLRLFSVVAATAVGPLMFLLARRGLGSAAALLSGLLVITAPTLAYASILSYESAVLACGLTLFVLHDQVQRGGPGTGWARLAAVVVCVFGAWMDWAFGFYVFALLIWSLPARPGELVRRLWQPWLVYFFATVLVFGWIWWAKQAPFLEAQGVKATFDKTLGYAVFKGPPLGPFFMGLGRMLRDAFTIPVLAVAVVGVVPTLWKSPRLFFATLLPAALNIGIFRSHSFTHLMFIAYLAPVVALSVATLLGQLGRVRLLRIPAIVVGAGLVVLMAWDSTERKRGASQKLFRQFGATVSAIGDGKSPDGDPRPVLVATNAPQYYPYYIHSPRVLLTPVLAHTSIDKQRGGGARLRYVYVQTELRMVGQPPASIPDEPLRNWLGQFPRHELPELVGDWPLGRGDVFVVLGAWVYDL